MPGRRTEVYDERRAAIRRTAARLFADRGFGPTTLHHISFALDRSKPYVASYYVSKAHLLHEVLDHHLDALHEAIGAAGEDPDPRAWLDAIALALLDAIAADAAAHRLFRYAPTYLPFDQAAALEGRLFWLAATLSVPLMGSVSSRASQ